jgi:autoinducer 2 (AI-2) kinase
VKNYLLALDLGHGGGHALLVEAQGGEVRRPPVLSAEVAWGYVSPGEDEFRQEFEPEERFARLAELVRELMARHGIAPGQVAGISATAMRHAFVLLGRDGEPLYGGPNTDLRGVAVQDLLEEEAGLDLFATTGQWPPLISLPARMLWFREEQPERLARTAHALSAADWLVYRMTGALATEPSLACATGFFDLRSGRWLADLLPRLRMGHVGLPEVLVSGTVAGPLRDDAAAMLGLVPGTPVAIGGGDSQLALLAAGVVRAGEAGVVAGTSTPVMQAVDEPLQDPSRRFWTCCHALPGRFVLESNAQLGGLTYEWLRQLTQQLAGGSESEAYARMEAAARAVPRGSDFVVASLGPEIFDASNLGLVRQAVIRFPQPAHPINAAPATFGHFVRAALENLAYAVRGNLEQLGEVGGQAPRLSATGGLVRSALWLEILSQVTGVPVRATEAAHGSGLGGAICAGVGAGCFPSLEAGAAAVVGMRAELVPERPAVEDYQQGYRDWCRLYRGLAEG